MAAREGFQCGADRVRVLVRKDIILARVDWIRDFWVAELLEIECRSG